MLTLNDLPTTHRNILMDEGIFILQRKCYLVPSATSYYSDNLLMVDKFSAYSPESIEKTCKYTSKHRYSQFLNYYSEAEQPLVKWWSNNLC